MKNLLALALISLSLFAAPPARAQDSLSAVAVVNDEIISELDLEMRIRMFLLSSAQADTPEIRQRLQADVLEALIDERLQAQEAARLGIRTDEAAVQEAFARIAASNNMEPGQLAEILTNSGVRPEYLLDQIEAQLLWQRVVFSVLRPQVNVSDEDVDQIAKQIEANAGQPQKRISEIFLPIDNVAQEAQVRSLAGQMYDALLQGASFSGIARQFSKATSAPQGGDRGWVDAGELIPEVEAALAVAAPGQILPPIETLNGIWIISYRESRATPESEVTVTLRQLFAPVASGKPEDLEAAARRLAELSGGIASCADAERVAQSNGMMSTFEMGTLSLDSLAGNLRNAVASLAIGRPSQPVQVPGGIAVLLVCERTEVGISLQKIRTRLEAEALEVLARRYMRDLRREATIETRL